MKTMSKLFALLTALCLLAGCAAVGGQTDNPQGSGQTTPQTAPASTKAAPTAERTEATTENVAPTPATVEPTPADVETTAAVGEPEGWEEEWPEEYPVEDYRLPDGAIQQTGRLNKYRYEQLDGAETYMDLAAAYVRETLGCGDALTLREDSPHDGYANWLMEAPNGSATVSGSSVTGRFVFSLYPGFDRILEMTERPVTDRGAMEQAARDFANRFSVITGDLELVKSADEEQHYHDERSSGMRDVVVPAVVYTFRSGSSSKLSLEIQDGLDAPVLCGDSDLDDLSLHCFTVTVWPDGTVVRGNNYITRAKTVPDGSVRMPDAGDVPELISYLSSMTEHDVIVIEELRADRYSVYFGCAEVEPLLTMTYHFESDPADRLSTEFVAGLLGDE